MEWSRIKLMAIAGTLVGIAGGIAIATWILKTYNTWHLHHIMNQP